MGISETGHLVAVVGPTATGKTALAVNLAGRLGGEIINADSRQVYRGMNTGTAKPSPEEQAAVRHWLIDVADPDEPFSLGRYLDLADGVLKECWSGGVIPFLVGGTGQYVWALLEGWQVPRVPPDRRLRAELEELAEREGPERLAKELADVDPESAGRIDSRNVRRVIRAIEVYRVTGRPLSYWRTRRPPDFASTIVGLTCPREVLYQRIDARVDRMMALGLLDEVRDLIEAGYGCGLRSMSGIGYRQVCQHLSGECSLEEAVAHIKTETHRLARMQHAWFRQDDERIHWINIAEGDPFPKALRIVESEIRQVDRQ